MTVILVLAISALFQIFAAVCALRLIKITGRIYSWIFISSALFFMVFRRLISIYNIIFTDSYRLPNSLYEFIGLILSLLMFLGVLGIGPIFVRRRKTEERYHSLLDNMMEGYQVLGTDWQYIYVNDSVAKQGRSSQQKLVGQKIYDIYPGIENTTMFSSLKKCMGERTPIHMENEFTYPDGSTGWFDLSMQPVPDGVSILSIDITERKKAEVEIGRLNRVYAFISRINQMAVKTRKKEILFSNVCRIAIEYGKFRMAWIGLIDKEDNSVRPVSWDGDEEGYLTTIKRISVNDIPEGRGPTGTAVRTGKVVFCNDIANDPSVSVWRDEAIKRGYRSSIALPVFAMGKAIGAFTIYAHEPFFFTDAEVKLLEEVTGNISYVLEIIELERKRKAAEDELHEYHVHLEELVRDRTSELEKINTMLEAEIKDRVRIEEELAKGHNMLRTLIDSLPDEIYAKDNESRFIMANSHVLRTFGRSGFEEIEGKTDFDILPSEIALKASSKEHLIFNSGGQTINYEECFDNNGGHRWYSITKVPMRNSEGRIVGLVGINRDITDFKEAEESLHAAKEAAESANRAKTVFLSSMSHEIRTPLNAILGFSELMLHDDNLNTQQIEYLSTINRSGEHLLALINDILEISKIEAGRIALKISGFDLYSLLEEMESMFRVKADEKNLKLSIKYSDDTFRFIRTDQKKLRQILINIIGNAVKFTRNGSVAVEVHTDTYTDGKNSLTVYVEDTGPGIAQKDIGNLFQMFGQTETGIKEEGTGLGLAISQQYAKIMGGVISVKSKVGEGSCFTITLDIEKGDEQAEEKVKPDVKYFKCRRDLCRVLIADDQADNRKLLRGLLESAGFAVDEAQDGMEAIRKFKASLPDLILMDIRMPVMNGYEAIKSIKSMGAKEIPIIAVTASAFFEDEQLALDSGADAYIRKPFKEHELFECIESCMGFKDTAEDNLHLEERDIEYQ